MKTIKKDRQKAISKMRRKFDLVQMAISYFTKVMNTRRASLIRAIENSKLPDHFRPSPRDVEYTKIMNERRSAHMTNLR